MPMSDNLPAAGALIDALAALRQAEAAINAALGMIGTDAPAPTTRTRTGPGGPDRSGTRYYEASIVRC